MARGTGDILDVSHVVVSDRPLVVCDVDDVVLHFAAPFQEFLLAQGHEFLPRSFNLMGNIVASDTRLEVDIAGVYRLIGAFFEAQESWQLPIEEVVQTLEALSADADVVFLTAMPPLYSQQRRRLLDRLGLAFPLIASEEPKGPMMRRLNAERIFPTTFIDDMAHNLHSVRTHMPDSLLIHMMPDSALHLMAPKPQDDIVRARDWRHAEELIRAHWLPR
ncbi:hypothetical protein GAO09_19860 [Rhizobiales bacterium RZME27]|jgi:hypothetical protein|uniref:HAD family hydrolase n=1 Tax=Endobacterium cereale TaxID=2663029 RepID=A0A6A8AAR1_9HYPH|nr:hypothetical protein [Endobacterium cereale]MEB2846081.1 hypothetical protein [Endobacterium cereale]MQY48292.1 hypothetical protein [Endobacterium cereale]